MKNKRDNTIFTILIISITFGLMVFLRSDPDALWHFSAGKYMVDHHQILTHDVFSWYLAGKYWMSHEWLFEVIIYLYYSIFSDKYLIVFSLVNVLGLLLLIYYTNKDDIIKNKVFSLFWLTFSIIIGPYIVGRPQLISYILLALTIYLLKDLYDNKDSKKIYFLPLIGIIWSNVHGGSSNLIYIYTFIFMICSLFNFKFSKLESTRKSKKQILTYLIVGLLCMLTININPHGFKMFLYPYQNLNDSFMVNNITEWRATSLAITADLFYVGFVFFIFMVMLLSKKKIRLLDFIIFLSVVFLGFRSVRFWAYTYIIMSYFIYYYIPKRKDDPGTQEIIMLISIGLLIVFGLSYKNIYKNTHKLNISEKMINRIKYEKPKRLYNVYDLGGELIYNDIKVFIDGRADLYSKYNFMDAVNISRLGGDFKERIKYYNFDYLLVNSDFQLQYYLNNSDEYELVYSDKGIYLYKVK